MIEPLTRGIQRAIRKAGLIDCDMIARVAVAEPDAFHGGMRLMKKAGERPHNALARDRTHRSLAANVRNRHVCIVNWSMISGTPSLETR